MVPLRCAWEACRRVVFAPVAVLLAVYAAFVCEATVRATFVAACWAGDTVFALVCGLLSRLVTIWAIPGVIWGAVVYLNTRDLVFNLVRRAVPALLASIAFLARYLNACILLVAAAVVVFFRTSGGPWRHLPNLIYMACRFLPPTAEWVVDPQYSASITWEPPRAERLSDALETTAALERAFAAIERAEGMFRAGVRWVAHTARLRADPVRRAFCSGIASSGGRGWGRACPPKPPPSPCCAAPAAGPPPVLDDWRVPPPLPCTGKNCVGCRLCAVGGSLPASTPCANVPPRSLPPPRPAVNVHSLPRPQY